MNLRPLMILPPLVLAILGFNWMTREQPQDVTRPEEARLAVRVMEIVQRPVSASVTGYGRVGAVRDWSAVAEVQGRINSVPGDLAEGSIVEAGDVLFEIDVTDYELARQKAQANISAAEAQIHELQRQEENSRKTLELEERTKTVAQAEFDRVASLVERGASTQAALDTAQKTLLAQSNSVLTLENTLALFPAQIESLEATLAVRRSELREAERSIEKATITAPFRGRVSGINAETGQFIRTGDTLLTLDDISAAEVTAEIQPTAFMPIFMSIRGQIEAPSDGIDPAGAIALMTKAGVTAEVRVSLGDRHMSWPAELVRMRGTLDADTATMGIVVRVEAPTISQPELQRARLDSGAFVSVVFTSPPVAGSITVPRSALRYDDDGAPFVYLADAEDRLARAPLDVGPSIGEDSLIFGGLEGGERLVLSEPSPPVIGMALDPVASPVAAAQEQ
ncbi:HlyD family efflux transporter periplasmic adaptor subunit [Tropicimonas sp. TH_r6]|uniref:efflux RND transporter periplasmic adaptor subunit n=1 Tax=Tropicimonas sp. TH_r6 TaxID=3082085 RepID=UPI00295595CC|nr:HlyD family efflux transporter periplasmic adaptor subunit [Tropicimonas sp. TH_r6]MDV7145456.1 HlyD family efflux transporter periplasmic adaptor subunit [Tropicimonas sp. TH_r6]